MSAAAPALAQPKRRTVAIRLADAAATIGYLSLIFALLLVFFPVSFPRLILIGWQRGLLVLAMMAITLVVDACLYFRVAYRLRAHPAPLAAMCLGALPILVAAGLSVVLQNTVNQLISLGLPNLQARLTEEVLAHTYLGLVSGIFLPFLVIRLLQQLRSTH